MPTQKQLLDALDTALTAHIINTLFPRNVSPAAEPNGFEQGIKRAIEYHAKFAEIIKDITTTAPTGLQIAKPRPRKRPARTS
jgi:hypothetical protein